jgi:hypothetical protein
MYYSLASLRHLVLQSLTGYYSNQIVSNTAVVVTVSTAASMAAAVVLAVVVTVAGPLLIIQVEPEVSLRRSLRHPMVPTGSAWDLLLLTYRALALNCLVPADDSFCFCFGTRLWACFNSVDTDRSGSITANELRELRVTQPMRVYSLRLR